MSTKIGTESAVTAKGRAAKERIYAASIRLVNAKGYEALTVPAICAEAGVSIGAFYHHFDSKGDILLRYIREESDALLEFYRRRSSVSSSRAAARTTTRAVSR